MIAILHTLPAGMAMQGLPFKILGTVARMSASREVWASGGVV